MARKDYVTKTLSLPNGKRKYIYGKTEAEAEEKLQEAKMLLRAGIKIDDDITVGELAQMWFDVEKKPNPNENTVGFWQDIINRNVLPILSPLCVQEVRPMHIKMTMNAIQHKSKSENRHTLQAIRGIFNFAVDNSIILKSPVPSGQKAKGVGAKEKTPLTKQQEKTLLYALDGTRAYDFVYLGLKTGLRRGELAALCWDCVDFKNMVISVRRNLVVQRGKEHLHEYTKSETSNRQVPITQTVADMLKLKKARTKSPFVFTTKDGRMLTANAIRNLWNLVNCRKVPQKIKIGKDGKPLPNKHPNVRQIIDFHVTPHILRHTYATRCFEDGMDVKQVQKLLGHKDPTVTLKIYIHFCEAESLKKTHEAARKAMDY